MNVENITAYHIGDCYRIVFINGEFSPQHSLLDNLPEKIILTHSSKAMIDCNDLFQQVNLSAQLPGLSQFHWLNGALSGDGLFLFIPDNVELTKPIHLLYLTLNENTSAAVMRHPRHHIQLGVNSRVSLLEEYVGLGATNYFNNVMTKVSAGRNAQLNYYKLQRESTAAFHIANTQIEQAQDSQVRAFHIALGGRLNREDVNFSLQQTGAACELSGFYYPQAQQHIDFHTRIDHQSAQTHSKQYYKGMIAAQGYAVFNGKVNVHPQAQRITAEQTNHNLLLDESAEVNTKPELAVFADNVRCSHGATVGNLDPNALFYLRSRGIPEKLARRLLMHGFVNEILDRLPDPLIVNYVKNQVISGES